MTNQSKAVLEALFETGDVPTGANYTDLIDSSVNLAETSAQTMIGPLVSTEFIGPRVSATNVNVTGTLSAAVFAVNTVTASSMAISGSLAVGTTVSAASLNVTGDVSAATGTVYASAVRSTNGVLEGVGIVSAAGTTQGAATVLSNVINRGKGVTDGSTTGFAIPANRIGLTQVIVNDNASANLWPPTGGVINALAANAAFAMAANIPYIIYHITASAYAVK
jgi:hypothetical protein